MITLSGLKRFFDAIDSGHTWKCVVAGSEIKDVKKDRDSSVIIEGYDFSESILLQQCHAKTSGGLIKKPGRTPSGSTDKHQKNSRRICPLLFSLFITPSAALPKGGFPVPEAAAL